MPELPEVETIRRQLAPRLENQRVIEADAFPSAKFTPATEVIGATFGRVGRRGKYLLLPTRDGRELVVHLGMTGQLRFRAEGSDPHDPHVRAWWLLDGPHGREILEFIDTRRFGRLRVVAAGDYAGIPTLHAAGPEPWDPALTATAFHRALARSRRAVKTQLLSQRPVAGVGNIYADEALWAAGISPRATRVGRERAGRLLEEIRHALEGGIAAGGTTLRDYRTVEGTEGTNQHRLRAYGRAGRPCVRCGETLRSGVIDGRSTTWCPSCQHR